jgi:zinc protease
VRYIPTVEESIERTKAISVDDLKELHKDLFGADNATITAVGDFDEKELAAAIERNFGNWRAKRPYKRIDSPFRGDIKGSDEVINTPDKKMALVVCAVNVKMRDDDPDYPAMHLSNYVLGSSAKSRLLERLRQKEGISYGAGSGFMASSQDQNAMFLGMGICASENADQAYNSLLDEFDILIRDGIGPEELADAKASFALQIKNRLANDSSVARMLNQGLYLNRTMDYYKKLYDDINKLTPGQVHQALKKHVQLNRMVKVKAGDLESKSGAVD